jgi:hypothetical protein
MDCLVLEEMTLPVIELIPAIAVSCYNRFRMKERIKGTGYLLIFIGTLGLILNEFVFENSTAYTLTSAGMDILGFIFLAIGHYGVKKTA